MQRLTRTAVAVAVFLWAIGSSFALPMGTVDFNVEATGLGPDTQFCMQGTFADATYDVFGTSVDLGTQVTGLVCNGGTDAQGNSLPVQCTSYPTPGIFDFTGSITVLFDQNAPSASFVIDQTTATGTLPQALGADVAYTFDGRATAGSIPSLPGCTLSNVMITATGHGGINAFQGATTVAGTDVPVSTATTFFDPFTNMETPVSADLTFSNVTSPGSTTITASSNASAALTDNFSISFGGYQSTFLDVKTTATFDGPVTICTSYADADDDGIIDGTSVPETALSFLHEEGDPLTFVDRTSSRDTVNNVICAEVSSFSHFVTAVRTSGVCAAPGDPCDDGNACTTVDVCDANLVCVGSGPPPDCDDGSPCTLDSCVAPAGCTHTPVQPTGCLSAPKSVLHFSVNPTKPNRDTLLYKWLQGTPMLQTDFGDPTNAALDNGYSLCVFDGRGVVTLNDVAPSGTCGVKAKPCWSPVKTNGYKFTDSRALQDGINTVKVLGNSRGKSSVYVHGKSVSLPVPPLPLVPPVTAYVVREDAGICFTSTFDSTVVKKNLPTVFQAVTPP